MQRWRGRVALVTGASVGIGAACVRNLVSHGVKVVAFARNVDQIQRCLPRDGIELCEYDIPWISKMGTTMDGEYYADLVTEQALKDDLSSQPGSVYPFKCDVTKEDQILAVFAAVRANPDLGGIDICINNAGCARNASLLEGETEKWRDMFEVNVLGPAICTREAVKSMREREVDDGQVIYISSMSAHRIHASKTTHFYGATKHAVRAMLEGVRHELRMIKSNIRVAAISPGLVETEIITRLHEGDKKIADEMFSSIKAIQPQDIADQVAFILSAPPYAQIHDILSRPTEQVH